VTTVRRLATLARDEPAILAWALSAAATAWAAFGFRAPAHDVAAVALTGTAIVTILTALAARPASVPVITGAVVEILTASAAFGLHLTSAQIGAAAPLVSIVVSLLLRQALTPVVPETRAHP
jgi:hypothetical protein